MMKKQIKDYIKVAVEIIEFIIMLPLLPLVIGLLYMFSLVFKSNTPEEQLREFGINLLGFEFESGFEILETMSQNGHPDRPQKLRIKLNDDEFQKLKRHLDTIPEGEERAEKRGNLYIKSISKKDNCCFIRHSSIHKDINYTFFIARGDVDYSNKTISFSSTFI